MAKLGNCRCRVQIVLTLAGLPFGTKGVAVAAVMTSLLSAIPSISYAGYPIGISAALVIRAVLPQFIAAICAAAGGWLLQTTLLTEYVSLVRILISSSFCISIYLIIMLAYLGSRNPSRSQLRSCGTL